VSIAHSPYTRRPLTLEFLEPREVPSVTVNDNPGNYRIDIDAGESVAVGVTAGGDLRVTVDGADLNIPARAAGTIAFITVTATGKFNNTIDLTGVSTAAFTSLLTIEVNAGGGNDTINGSEFGEVLYGGGGNDTIIGNGGSDVIRGGAGNDVIRAGTGNDQVYGGPGNDKLFGGAGDDKLFGGAGNDTLIGGPGSDRLTGGAGIDVFITDKKDVLRDNAP
jgi:Ca2+-binding RTX toxin-like protein